MEDAVSEGGDVGAWLLLVLKNGTNAQVIGSNPHGIDSVVGLTVCVECVGVCTTIHVLRVGDESGDFIF